MHDWPQMSQQAWLGEAIRFRNLELFPLFSHRSGEPEYLLLDEALASGQARILADFATDGAPDLRLANHGSLPVLLPDGLEMRGKKLEPFSLFTVLNSILAPAGEILTLPPWCVEAQPSRSVQAAPRRQWPTSTATSAPKKEWEKWTKTVVRIFPAMADQCGALFAINGEIAGIDFFDSPSTFQKRHDQLVREYALEALKAPQWRGGTYPRLSRDVARGFLRILAAAPVVTVPSVGDGEELRFNTPMLAGAALLAHRHIVHLRAFPRHHSGVRMARAARARSHSHYPPRSSLSTDDTADRTNTKPSTQYNFGAPRRPISLPMTVYSAQWHTRPSFGNLRL